MHSQAFVDQLGKTGLGVFPTFISPELLGDAREDLEQLRIGHRFQRAGTGSSTNHTANNPSRTDETYWLSRAETTPTRDRLWSEIDRLRSEINRGLYLGLSEFEGHYAAYAEGGFYRRHLDSTLRGSARVVSFILYLNLDWQFRDGGQLRVYGQNGTHHDVAPIGGTLVCFLSAEKEHEVLTSHAERFSLTGWFRSRGSELI